MCETYQIIFVSSDFKETNKGLDDNYNEELRPDSVKLDDDKKISFNNTNNGSINEKFFDDESGTSEIRYVKSNEIVSEDKNLELEQLHLQDNFSRKR
ncbi:unnamed protein product [Rhizophagus irregularis]|nr:unnamed protein product [Rhizophagus irregularis]CAB5362700.1 unnamed protein product [Rhizophagus irregularis]